MARIDEARGTVASIIGAFLVLSLLAVSFEARAETGHQVYTTHTQTGVGSPQEQKWTVDHAAERPKGSQTFVGVSIDTATAGSWTISVTSNALVGCTLVTPITTSTTAFGGTARIELTLIDTDCHGVLHLTGTSGSMTASIRAGIDISTPSPDTKTWQQDFWWLFWIIAMVITHTKLTPSYAFRGVCDLLVGAVVAFPAENGQREFLMTATTIVLVIDIVCAALNPKQILGDTKIPKFASKTGTRKRPSPRYTR